MNFINPFLLLFAAASAIPLLLHLFNKQRVKIVEFSTVKYLQSLQKTRMRRVKIRQILLLILRTLALLALALAFARPTIEGGYLPALGGKTTTTAIIMLDLSGSMLAESNAGRAIDRALQKAEAILDNFTEKERVTLLAFADRVIYDSGEPSTDFERLREYLEAIEPSYAVAEPQAAMMRAFELLTVSRDPNLEIYLISDFQGDSWRSFEFSTFSDQRLEVSLFVTSVADGTIENVAVERITFPNQIVTVGRSVSLTGLMRNFKNNLSADLLVSLDVGGRKIAQSDISIPPAGQGKVAFTYVPDVAGFLHGVVTVDDDDLLADNRSYFAMRVPSTNRLALISEDDAEVFYLRNALAPETGGQALRQLVVQGQTQAGTANLFDYNTVIVNVRDRLQPGLVSSLRNYMNNGGAVLFLMRPDLNFAQFADEIARPMFGLSVMEAPKLPEQTAGKYLLNRFELDHPLFSPYKGISADKMPQAEFLGHFTTRESAATTVLARFSDNSPAIIEANVGRGKALLYTFSFDQRYSDIMFRPFAVILLNRSIEYLVSEPLNQREFVVAGSEVMRELGPQSARQFTLVTPSGDSAQIMPTVRAGATVFDLGRLDVPGIYRLYGEAQIVDLFAINFPPEESEPSYLDPSSAGAKVKGARVIVLESNTDPAEAIAAARFGTELWKLFLAFAFIFLFAEMVIAYSARQPEVSAA